MTTVNPMRKHATLRYTSMRVSIFLGCFLVVWLIALTGVVEVKGAQGAVLLVAIAAVLSAPISYVALSRQRDAMSEVLVDKVEQSRRRLADNRTQEDDADEAARTGANGG